jgi:hypothetical protein
VRHLLGLVRSICMDFTPRRVIQLVREGSPRRAEVADHLALRLVLRVRGACPRHPITDVMYTLKREAIAEKVAPKHFPIPVLASVFYDMVRKRGRTSEFWIVLRLMLRTHPLGLLGMARTGIALIRTGRLSLRVERVKARRELQAMLPPAEEVH